MKYISVFAVPVMILLFVGWGLIKRVNVYDCFIDGAKDGISSLVGIIPNLIGLMVAISMFRNSGALELLEKVFSPLLEITYACCVTELCHHKHAKGNGQKYNNCKKYVSSEKNYQHHRQHNYLLYKVTTLLVEKFLDSFGIVSNSVNKVTCRALGH